MSSSVPASVIAARGYVVLIPSGDDESNSAFKSSASDNTLLDEVAVSGEDSVVTSANLTELVLGGDRLAFS